jgi:hypothetical protein
MALHPYTHRLCYSPDLVLHWIGGKCVRRPCRNNGIRPELVLRGPKQDCAENPNEISAFDPELVLRDVPGKSAQWRWQPQRLGRLIWIAAFFYPAGDEVVRIPSPPRLLRLNSAGRLAIRLTTRSLSQSDSRIRPKPSAANTTGSLWSIRHGDP